MTTTDFKAQWQDTTQEGCDEDKNEEVPMKRLLSLETSCFLCILFLHFAIGIKLRKIKLDASSGHTML